MRAQKLVLGQNITFEYHLDRSNSPSTSVVSQARHHLQYQCCQDPHLCIYALRPLAAAGLPPNRALAAERRGRIRDLGSSHSLRGKRRGQAPSRHCWGI
jgi:hypothetical protein